MHVRAKQLGVAGVDEDGGKNDTADPDDEAAVIERGELEHGCVLNSLAESRFLAALGMTI